MEQLISLTQRFIVDITNLFPKDKIPNTYEKIIDERIERYNSLILGTEEYLKTLSRKGETNRIPEVLNNQILDIHKFVSETNEKIDFIKTFMDFLEYKEKEVIIPQVKTVISKWDEAVADLDKKMKELTKKF